MNAQRRLALGLVSLSAFYAGSGLALGLGELQLQSALNQPLQATIRVHDSQGLNPTDIRVALADAETFARVGMERPFFLTDLRFTPTLVDQQLVIRVDSSRPVNEPYLNFLVQLTRANGSLLREYTLLLDPPLYVPTAVVAASAAAPARTSAPSSEALPVRSVAMPAAPAADSGARAASPPALQPQPGGNRYQTVAGDSLWTIAAATRVNESVSIQRQMDAIYGLNPHAFVNGDPGRLRAEQQLVLPVAEQVGVSSAAVADVPEPAPAPRDLPAVSDPSDRLRIEEPALQEVTEETRELQQRLNIVENRFHGLLAELELRDAQIASLQADLESLRQSPEAVQQTDGAIAGGLGLAASDSDAAPAAPAADQVPGALESSTDWEQASEPQDSWIERWWPGLLALLTIFAAALLLRSRREPEQPSPAVVHNPVPQPITVPGSRSVDPLEGVDLYLTYGRLPEARLMLDKAIIAEPQRVDLRLRMLGVLAELGERQSFADHARQALEAGADQIQIDLIKARHPHLMQARQQDLVEPFEVQSEFLMEQGGTLNLDTDELEQSWGLLDELDGLSSRRREAMHHLEEHFESNLQDFPEVGEMNDDELDRFRTPDLQHRNN